MSTKMQTDSPLSTSVGAGSRRVQGECEEEERKGGECEEEESVRRERRGGEYKEEESVRRRRV